VSGGLTLVSSIKCGEMTPRDVFNLSMCAISFTGVGSLITAGYYVIDASIYVATNGETNLTNMLISEKW
jgi:hypothetical protein